MDTHENIIPDGGGAAPETQNATQQTRLQPEQQAESVSHTHGWNDARYTESAAEPGKTSPFADSPYVMHAQPVYTNTPKQTVKKQSSGKVWKGLTAALLAVALVVGSCAITASALNAKWEKQTEQLKLSMNEKINALQKQIDSSSKVPSVSGSPASTPSGYLTPAQVYEQCKNSVVAITNEALVSSGYFGQSTKTASSGSGFVLTEDGYIVSNHHVIADADRLVVTTYDGTEYEAELIGSDETNDIALLKIQVEGLQAVALGSSNTLAVGDQVVAIGNPLGELTSTQTVGYISGKDRSVSTDGSVINMLQTDAAINPGNSGGPLFDMYGQVVGITTAKYSGTTSSGASIEGIGFAIPLDDVLDMLNDLKDLGYITGAYLGISCYDSSVYSNLPSGVFVNSVTAGSCAEKGGVLAWDIIVELGGYEIENTNDLTRALRQFDAGDTVTVTVYRSGKEVILTLTLDEKPHEEQTTTPEEEQAVQPSVPKEGSYDEWYDFFFPNFGG